jgi:hypothetical protein
VTVLTVLATAAAKTASGSSNAPGALAFLVIFGMAIILVFLFRSMSKHLRKVTDPNRQGAAASSAEDAGTPGPGNPVGAASPPPYSTGAPGEPSGKS